MKKGGRMEEVEMEVRGRWSGSMNGIRVGCGNLQDGLKSASDCMQPVS